MKKISRRSFLQASALSAAAAALTACGQSVTAASTASSAAASTASSAAASAAADVMKIGFIYIGDDSEAYTANFIAAETAIKEKYGSAVTTIPKYKVAEDGAESPLRELCEAGCKLIFTTSFGYGDITKEVAAEYPDVQFCQATQVNASEDVPNYHTYMGYIYQGRYTAGIVAGMKLKELIDAGTITADQAKIGYVGAFAYAEVISGYTAFFLGVRSIVDTATMEVQYAGTWGDYDTEKAMATALIDNGCVLLSQHSDTKGPAVACKDSTDAGKPIFCVCYNQDMISVAPQCCLISSRIDWSPYELEAVQAVMDGKDLPMDEGAGFDKGWVAMTDLNTDIAAAGTQDAIDAAIAGFKAGTIDVYKGNYTGVNYEGKTIDLNQGYTENATQSAPAFDYVLNDVITVDSTN